MVRAIGFGGGEGGRVLLAPFERAGAGTCRGRRTRFFEEFRIEIHTHALRAGAPHQAKQHFALAAAGVERQGGGRNGDALERGVHRFRGERMADPVSRVRER